MNDCSLLESRERITRNLALARFQSFGLLPA
jgi:hypothetical protein